MYYPLLEFYKVVTHNKTCKSKNKLYALIVEDEYEFYCESHFLKIYNSLTNSFHKNLPPEIKEKHSFVNFVLYYFNTVKHIVESLEHTINPFLKKDNLIHLGFIDLYKDLESRKNIDKVAEFEKKRLGFKQSESSISPAYFQTYIEREGAIEIRSKKSSGERETVQRLERGSKQRLDIKTFTDEDLARVPIRQTRVQTKGEKYLRSMVSQ